MRMGFALFALLVLALIAAQGCSTVNAEKNAPPLGEFINVGDERVHLVDRPADAAEPGPPIVLIHGASVNLRDMTMALAEPLSGEHRVIAADRAGRGYSTRPDDGWRLERQAQLIHDAVTEIGVRKPVIVGQSFGGAVALAYALAYQDEMSGLVLLAPVSHEWPGGVSWYNNVSGWPVVGFAMRRLLIPLFAPVAAKSGIDGAFGPGGPPPHYAERAGLSLLFRPSDFKANAEDLRRLKPQIVEMSKRYGEINIPTAIMAGTDDETVSPKIHAQTLATEIPGASLEMLPETGHALHHTQTGKVVSAIERIAGEGGRAGDLAR